MPRKVVLGNTELSNHSGEKAGADLLAKILNSSEGLRNSSARGFPFPLGLQSAPPRLVPEPAF